MYRIQIGGVSFEWDEAKERVNRVKHGIGFLEAADAFRDPNAPIYIDPDQSDGEERYILIGFSADIQLVVVCHCYRDAGETVRIISARKTTPRERDAYEGYNAT